MIGDLVNGIAFGCLLFILASGFSIALGVIRVINIAHGAFYMLAVFLALSVTQAIHNFLLAILASSLALMVLAVLLWRFVLQRFSLDPLPQVLSTFGITLVIVETTRQVWGGYPRVVETPPYLAGTIHLGSVIIPQYRVFLMGVAVVLGLGLWYVIERTSLGALVRAAIDDEEMARSMGVNIDRLFMALFGLAGLLAGLGGALGAPLLGAYQGVEFEILTLTLVVVVLGGLGSLGGAFAGSMLVGVIDSVGKVNFPELSFAVLFAPMILVLSLRPTGLFGKKVNIDR